MAQNVRQNRLFAAEDYVAIYESYVNANLQAYDYDTIRNAMVSYVRDNYPENFNDWIESSEFVSILDLIAQFGHNLAFRVDMNSRNNFLSTAERQDAIFKLAEFLGYQPRRNLAASGLLKVVSIKTNEQVIGSQGTSLGGIEIRYENTNNIDNLDDFITIMNAILSESTQFGSPNKQATINGILTQFYNLNNTTGQNQFSISGKAQGAGVAYECVGMEYNPERKIISEVAPDDHNSFSLLFKNDGTGITSSKTGFFVGLKQGSLEYKDFNIQDAIDNLSVDIDAPNINDSDVWVQTITTRGDVQTNWTKVDNVYGSSTAFNTIFGGNRNIFSVKTRENNKISVQFADRNFGNLPKGLIRVWYRTSLNDTFVIRPEDIGTKSISVRYRGTDGNTYTATLGLQLKESITNASAAESLDDIKINAPRIYATQDRMITAQDYSSYLVRQSDNILKIKSINRTHSGQSRFVEYNDPTGSYTNVKLFGSDGTLTRMNVRQSIETSSDDMSKIFDQVIRSILNDYALIDTYYDLNYDKFRELRDQYNTSTIRWQNILTTGDVSTGHFISETNSILSVGNVSNTYLKFAGTDALIRFTTPTGDKIWTRVATVKNNGLGVDNSLGLSTGKTSTGIGAIALDASVPQGSIVDLIYPPFQRRFSESERESIITNMNIQSFVISYNIEKMTWEFLDYSDDFESWFIYVDIVDNNKIWIQQTVYKFTSENNEVVFSNTSNKTLLDEYTNKKSRDYINFVIYGETNNEYKKVYLSKLESPNTVYLTIEDKQADFRPDNPDVFRELLEDKTTQKNIRFEWDHVPAYNEIVDPSFTNIVDVFALTRVYDTQYRRYLSDPTGNVTEPLVPTIDELNQQFKQINNKKAMSDKIIYRPVKYKPLFGPKAIPELQGRFRVVKVMGSNMTDNEIKSRIVSAISAFFDLGNWDFGESFYFTELAAFVHKQLTGSISSLVIVPEYTGSVFGDLFEITCDTDEIFIPDIGIDDIDIINSINETTIKA